MRPAEELGLLSASLQSAETARHSIVNNAAIAMAAVIATAIKVCKAFDALRTKALQAYLMTLQMHGCFRSAYSDLKGRFSPVRSASR